MHKIVRISIFAMHETCQRWTYFVRATTDEGMTREVESHRTGSVYTNFEGLSREEARDRALIDAADWGDFLGITPDTFVDDDDVTYQPSMTFDRYTTRRELKERA